MIEIMNLRTDKPRLPDIDIRVDRSNKILGNPFFMPAEERRNEVCDKYRDMPKDIRFMNEISRLRDIYHKYNRLRLFCWCAPKRCHAETIRDLILAK